MALLGLVPRPRTGAVVTRTRMGLNGCEKIRGAAVMEQE
jgi:hypothetical protein